MTRGIAPHPSAARRLLPEDATVVGRSVIWRLSADKQRRRAVDDGSSAFGEDGANISAFDESKVVVLMVVQEGERNVMDQQILEQELWQYSHRLGQINK